ncbi:DUF4365 domain-containing protein [Candidatus Poriferisodalis sp.]|uniref:DUF4365 domain-containing protein n=1 Tax=Candidatus Poriferisodalis sp. TaxID=3101277 RepID=UPI003B029706
MALQKTYTESDQIGEEGQRLAALTVTQLGHIWHDRRVDHGVDGAIELVDPLRRAASNVHLMVQSKATAKRFPGETTSSFHLLLDANDVTYWRGGSNRVVVVCSKPRDGDIWWAPVDRATPPPPGRKSWRIEFDKEQDRLDASTVDQLLTWAANDRPGQEISGRQRRTEILETNLLQITDMPQEIFFGPTWQSNIRRLGPALRERGYMRTDWILRGGQIYSFTRPRQGGLRDFLDGGFETIDTREWAQSKDSDTTSMFADLLRQALLEQEHRNLRYHSKKRLFVFRSPRDGRDALRVKVAPNKPGRTVYQRYFKDDKETEPKDCRHYAAAVRFVDTDVGWAAEINPTYHFTFDGQRDLPWGEDRVKGMKKIEKNAAVRGLTGFWGEYLGRPPELGEGQRPLQFGHLMQLQVEVGINDKDWRPSGGDEEGHADDGLSQQELWR